MPFKDLLKKKEKLSNNEVAVTVPAPAPAPAAAPRPELPKASEFTFVRTDTNTEEVIQPPFYEGDVEPAEISPDAPATTPPTTPKRERGFGRFRKTSSATSNSPPAKEHRRLSQRLHITPKSRASSTSSVNVPSDLPTIPDAYSDTGDRQEKEAQWEERATILAQKDHASASSLPGPAEASAGVAELSTDPQESQGHLTGEAPHSSSRARSVSDATSDLNIQEAIRLHEAGELAAATSMFGRLAASGNVLSQVLYGLSLRHGWGCTPDPKAAVTYLQAAASNSAEIESEALKAGMKKGGAAKGELVLAIFELANCFRNGWGVEVDKVAARQYYETAANLGDTDAMNEAAWCYLEGFGGKKDKFKAAQLLRLAEKNGAKTLGNTWIWKDKYNPPT